MTVIIFLLVLAVLIFVHELGHFIFAKANGIRVDAFALGFGPKIISWQGKETRYSINIIPFGGYVKIFGENPDAESMTGPDASRSFVNKQKWQQVIVLVAGVFFNFLFAWLLYISVFAHGVTATTDGFEKYAADFHNPRIMITEVLPGSPAEKAGIKVGDVVVGDSIEKIQQQINGAAGSPLSLNFLRNKETTSIIVAPVEGLVEGKYAIGIAMNDVADLQLPFLTAIYEGGHYTLIMMRDTALGLYTFVTNIFRGHADFSDVSGPVGIAGIVGNAAELGFTYLMMITALISINLGIINLVPFPALDGGRVLFVIIEAAIRRRISPKFSNTVNTVGFALLMLLMIVVTYKDIARLFK